jgi:hypothetical protein
MKLLKSMGSLETMYCFRALIPMGCDLFPKQSKLSVKVAIGGYSFVCRPQQSTQPPAGLFKRADNAVRRFGALSPCDELDSSSAGPDINLRLPAAPEQIPDILVHVTNDKDEIVSFIRVSAADLLKDKFGLASAQGPTWQFLQREGATGAVSEKAFPGLLMMWLGLGLASTSAKSDHAVSLQHWRQAEKEAAAAASPENLELSDVTLVLYQGRALPAEDSDG